MTCYSKPTFPLLKLPYLPFDLIIQLMKIGEIMLMSICSKRLSYLVKLGKYQLNGVHIHLKPGDLQIEVNRTSKDYCDFCFNSEENGGLVPKGCDSLSKWFRNGNSAILNLTATHSFEDIITVASRLRTDFRVQQFCYKLFLEELKNRNLKELFLSLDFGTCFRVSLVGGEINTETLSFFIDGMDFKMRLVITSAIPSDFKHPRALDFSEIKYEDARWMTVEDLKSIRNGSHVNLIGRTNFDNHDINELIKYWTECKEMMFTTLRIRLREGVNIDEFSIVKEVISCYTIDEKRYFYISKKLIQTHSIGSVEFADGIVTLTSWIFDSQLGYIVPVLKLLEQRSDLTIRYSEIMKKEREWQGMVASEEDEVEMEQDIIKIQTEKRNIQAKFSETIDKLKILGVDNFDVNLDHIA